MSSSYRGTATLRVGDPDQSVYRWRAPISAHPRLREDFPDCLVIPLEQNYRSTKRILDIASGVIAHNTARRDKRLWTENARRPAQVYRAWDENEEAGWVAQTIARSIGRADYRDVAVFYARMRSPRPEDASAGRAFRTSSWAACALRAARDQGPPAYLRLVVNPLDDIAFRRAVAAPSRGMARPPSTGWRERPRARSLVAGGQRGAFARLTPKARGPRGLRQARREAWRAARALAVPA